MQKNEQSSGTSNIGRAKLSMVKYSTTINGIKGIRTLQRLFALLDDGGVVFEPAACGKGRDLCTPELVANLP
jgi:hypothetical protein